jgi:hypothetical protein
LISVSSSMASSAPATSANVTGSVFLSASLARDLPNCMILPPPPWAWLSIQTNRPRNSSIGSTLTSKAVHSEDCGGLSL